MKRNAASHANLKSAAALKTTGQFPNRIDRTVAGNCRSHNGCAFAVIKAGGQSNPKPTACHSRCGNVGMDLTAIARDYGLFQKVRGSPVTCRTPGRSVLRLHYASLKQSTIRCVTRLKPPSAEVIAFYIPSAAN